ncbi:MAG: beta-ketoacyl-ACP synthase III [Salinisphaeraceae bacterium]|nr:beta-ketoacyl-ACP synthase III [Salinisphaeraceae bacterium]
MQPVVISGSGLYTPPDSITNEELVEAFNAFVDLYNEENAEAIKTGAVQPLVHSSAEFIEKASGIKSRHVVDKRGILDPKVMHPLIRTRSNDEPSLLAEMAVDAAKQALDRAGRSAEDIDAVLAGCSNMPRAYPSLAVEVQEYLGIDGWAFDLNVACASAAFGLQAAVDAIRNGSARRVLMVNPEICSGHLNFRDRDSHFIFGDAATAVIVEHADDADADIRFDVLGTRLKTKFSNNIRNNFGFLNRAEVENPRTASDILFVQEGRKVFKEVVPMVAQMLIEHLQDLQLDPASVKRFWLHQANLSMNLLISKKVLGREPTELEAPIILDEYANTSSAGSIIAFHKYHEDLQSGDTGVICAFGAGYSAGSVVIRRI